MSSIPISPQEMRGRRKRSGGPTPQYDGAEYTIQEAAAKLGIAEQKLRRWDTQGVLVARRTDGGHRRYSREIVDGLAVRAGSDLSKSDSDSDELARALQDLKEKRRIIQLLVESESRYRDLVETSHDLIWTTDAVGRFSYLNNGTIDIFGLEPSALIGRCFFDFESNPSHISNRRFLSTLRKHGEIKDYLTHLIAADGTDRWVGINARVCYDNGRITGIRGTARNVTEQHRAALEIEYLATHDALTGLPNQVSLTKSIEESLAEQNSGAVMRIDVDRFQRVTDDHGHRVGDEILIAISGVLRDIAADQGLQVYRCGADKFAIHLFDVSPSAIESIGETILRALRNFTPKLPGTSQLLQLAASVGVAVYSANGEEASSLLNRVECAISEAKLLGRNRCVINRPGEKETNALDERKQWTQDLRDALDEDRLILYSQPVLNLSNPESNHQELFVRLAKRDGLIVSPPVFMGIAESIGLAREIDLRVIEKTLEHIKEIPSLDTRARYFINLSHTSVFDPHWLPRFFTLLANASLDLKHLVFEISESAAMSNVEMAKSLFTRLKEIGCGCALDNFGTGFSSLYYLKQFDVDFLKVDGAFAREIATEEANRLFIQALNEVAKGLDREVIAAGVETPELLAQLRDLGMSYVQGFHLGRPMPLNASGVITTSG